MADVSIRSGGVGVLLGLEGFYWLVGGWWVVKRGEVSYNEVPEYEHIGCAGAATMSTIVLDREFSFDDDGCPPPLENGDRLTRPEFERRYAAMPGVKAELIEGMVLMASPVQHKKHGRPHLLASAWMSSYWMQTDGIDAGSESTLRLDLDNEPQPDLFLMILPECGGQATFTDDDYIEGAPELVMEVASSSASIDLHRKLNAYRRNGVREYLVWRVRDGEIDWFALRNGEYVRLIPDTGGVYHSEVFPRLVLDVAAMVRGDVRAVVRVQQEALKSPEHAAFVARLAETATEAK